MGHETDPCSYRGDSSTDPPGLPLTSWASPPCLCNMCTGRCAAPTNEAQSRMHSPVFSAQACEELHLPSYDVCCCFRFYTCFEESMEEFPNVNAATRITDVASVCVMMHFCLGTQITSLLAQGQHNNSTRRVPC